MVAAWFGDWLTRHLQRHEALGLATPAANKVLYDGWRDEFHRLRISEEQAESASKRLLSRRPNKATHFADLMRLAIDKPAAPVKQETATEGPDYTKPESLTREQRRERIRVIRSELPAIELSASSFPKNQWYAKAAAAGRAELEALETIDHAERKRERERHLHPYAR